VTCGSRPGPTASASAERGTCSTRDRVPLLIDTARLHAMRAEDDLDAAAADGRLLTVAERARVRMDTAVAAMRTREAVDMLLSVAGASAFALSSALQKIWRDLGTASRHGTVNPNLAREVYGRALLGIADQPTPPRLSPGRSNRPEDSQRLPDA
jgi:hypothetical protein